MGEFLFYFIVIILGLFALGILWFVIGLFKQLNKASDGIFFGCLSLLIIIAIIALVLSFIF